MEFIGYFCMVLMGATLGLLGGGGSILTVPILAYLFGLSATISTAYSLFIVGLTALIGSVSYARKKLLDWQTGITFAIPAFLGVYTARRFVVPALPETFLTLGNWYLTKDAFIMIFFAVVMLVAALSMISKKTKSLKPHSFSPLKRYTFIAIEGIVVGVITGFVGAGGGFLIVPALVLLAGLPMKTAVGTSLAIIAFKSLFGFIGDIQTQESINWSFLLIVSGISMVGIFIGTKLSHHISNEKLKPAFGWFVLVMGIFILMKELI